MNEQAVSLPDAASPEIIPAHCLEGDIAKGCLLICDHAANGFPGGAEALGLGTDQLERHIAYDIGAAGVTRRLSTLMGVPAVLSGFSRLLIDPNRGLDDPTLIMRLSDGAVIPANRAVDEAEAERRVRLYYEPYHAAIDARVDAAIGAGAAPVLVSIHSFTGRWKGRPRPWHVTVLWDQDPRLPLPLIDALRREPGLVVGENVPYSGELKGDTLYRHGTGRGLAHALLEIRQDLIADEAGQQEWAERLSRVLTGLFAEPTYARELHVIRHHGSQTDAPRGQRPPRRPHGTRSNDMTDMDAKTKTELEAAVFRRLVSHLMKRTDVQNIDLMNLAGFCRNCLSNWYREAAESQGLGMTKDESREIVYGMSYEDWKTKHQTEAGDAKLERFEETRPAEGH